MDDAQRRLLYNPKSSEDNFHWSILEDQVNAELDWLKNPDSNK